MVTAKLENGNIVITLPANTTNPPVSKQGRSRMVAGTSGFTVLDGIQVNGEPVRASINIITTLGAVK